MMEWLADRAILIGNLILVLPYAFLTFGPVFI